jgi:hypothetical protein
MAHPGRPRNSSERYPNGRLVKAREPDDKGHPLTLARRAETISGLRR